MNRRNFIKCSLAFASVGLVPVVVAKDQEPVFVGVDLAEGKDSTVVMTVLNSRPEGEPGRRIIKPHFMVEDSSWSGKLASDDIVHFSRSFPK